MMRSQFTFYILNILAVKSSTWVLLGKLLKNESPCALFSLTDGVISFLEPCVAQLICTMYCCIATSCVPCSTASGRFICFIYLRVVIADHSTISHHTATDHIGTSLCASIHPVGSVSCCLCVL